MTPAWLSNKLMALEAKVERMVGAVVEYTTLSRTTASGQDFANVADDSTVSPRQQRPVRRISPWGLSGFPVSGVLAGIVKAVGGALGGLVVGVSTTQYGPQNLNEGETALWNKVSGCQVLLDQNGNVVATSSTGKTIQLNGTTGVARLNDTTAASTLMAAWMAQVETAINILAPGAVTPLSPTFSTSSGIGKINQASTKTQSG